MTVVSLTVPRLPVAIWLPFPPSLNRLWRTVNGRPILSKPYRAWKLQAGLHLNTQFKRPIAGRFSLSIVADRPDNRRRDIDNIPKAALDILTAHRVIEDDHLAASIAVRWSDKPPARDAKIWLTIEEVE